VVSVIVAALLGLAPNQLPSYSQSDKVLHSVTFFIITTSFYWILETSRRRVVNLTLVICTAGLGIGSEILQGLLPNDRDFDLYDILANVIGSGLALLACSWYHKRMLERRRQSKTYDIVPGEELDEQDLELGEGVGTSEQETGVIDVSQPSVTEQLDNWDENAEEWDEDEPVATESTDGEGQKTPASSTDGPKT